MVNWVEGGAFDNHKHKNNKTAKIKAIWSFPMFRLDKPSFFRGFDEESESRYHSNSKGLICLRPIFRLKKLAFLGARATLEGNTIKAPIYCPKINQPFAVLPALYSVLFLFPLQVASGMGIFTLEIRQERTSRFHLQALSGPLHSKVFTWNEVGSRHF